MDKSKKSVGDSTKIPQEKFTVRAKYGVQNGRPPEEYAVPSPKKSK